MRFSSISARYRDVELGVAPHAVLGHVETRRLDMLLDADSPERLHRPEAAERRGECEAADRGEPDGLHAELVEATRVDEPARAGGEVRRERGHREEACGERAPDPGQPVHGDGPD